MLPRRRERSIAEPNDAASPSEFWRYALRLATPLPSESASSQVKRSRWATTSVHNVNTGARLMEMVLDMAIRVLWAFGSNQRPQSHGIRHRHHFGKRPAKSAR